MFTLWILEPDKAVFALILSIWKKTAPDHTRVRSFKRLSSLWKAAVSEGLPDLIMGEWMPGSDRGTEFMIHIRRLGSVDLLPVTSDDRQLAFSRAIQSGAFDYVLKPFSEDRLQQSILRYFTLRNLFASGQPLSQKDIDRFLLCVSSDQRTATKQIISPSPQKKKAALLIRHLKEHPEGLSTAEISHLLLISRTAALDLLSSLEKEHMLLRKSVHTGMPGRPRNLYFIHHFDRKEKS